LVRLQRLAPSSTKYATLVERVQEEKASGADAYDGALCKGVLTSLEVYRKLEGIRFIGGRAWLRFVEQPKQQQAVHYSAALFFSRMLDISTFSPLHNSIILPY
jgi:hypothetical protein